MPAPLWCRNHTQITCVVRAVAANPSVKASPSSIFSDLQKYKETCLKHQPQTLVGCRWAGISNISLILSWAGPKNVGGETYQTVTDRMDDSALFKYFLHICLVNSHNASLLHAPAGLVSPYIHVCIYIYIRPAKTPPHTHTAAGWPR